MDRQLASEDSHLVERCELNSILQTQQKRNNFATSAQTIVVSSKSERLLNSEVLQLSKNVPLD